MAMAPAIGIDLGTKYSCVAVFRHGKVEVIANEHDDRTTPSCVAFTNTERLFGDVAKNQMDVNPSNTIFDVKRLIGRNFDDATVQSDMNHWPFDVVSSDGGKPKIQIVYKGETKTFFPEEVSSMVLTKMKETAEAYLGRTVQDAVISVPACFSDSQRQATLDAGAIAGLNVRRLISEPTAAAFAYGLNNKGDDVRNVLIFDLGGGTFDVSILTIDDAIFDMRSSSGDTHLGGEDFDNRMVAQLVQEFQRKYRKDLRSDKRALRRLRTACERAKRMLSAATRASIEVHSLFDGIDFCTSFTRARFEELNADLFSATMEHVRSCLRYAKMDKSEIDDIVLVGGSTRIPRVQELLRDFFDGKELNRTVNPDEAVAYGAAAKAAFLNRDMSETLLEVDVKPMSIGIADDEGIMTPIIERNASVPTKQTHFFTTVSDNQPVVYIRVFEGNCAMIKNNNLLGTFEVAGIPPAPPGEPQIEVAFEIDMNGILSVWIVDKTTNEKRQIPNKRCFSKEEIEHLAGKAQIYRRVDDMRRQTIDAKNALESYCIDIKSTVVDKCNETIKWLDANQQAGKEEYERKHKELENACYSVVKLHGSWRR